MLNLAEKYGFGLRAPDGVEGGGAGTSAPSPEPVAPSPVSNEATSDPAPSPETYEALGLDEIELPSDSGPGAGTEPAAEPQPDATQPAPTASTAPAPAAAAKPDVAPAVVSPPSPKEVSSPPSTPEAILQGIEDPAMSKDIRQWLSANLYSLSDEEKQELDTNAVEAIPRLMSRVHLEATKNTLKLISTLVPQLVERQTQQMLASKERSSEAMDEFFKSWPSLTRAEHSPLVDQFARTFRQMNPQASRADAIKFVGAAIHAHLGIAPKAAASNGNGAAAPRRGGAPPFAPARPGARQIASQPVPANPFEGLGQDFDEG